jgi:adenylate kinase family enzyme
MRVVVYGTTGSGKSTFAQKLASVCTIPCIELDLINWRPGWVGRNEHDVDGFVADVRQAIAAKAWVATGSYGDVRRMMWARATDVVFLDLPRYVVMWQVISRSFVRATSGTDVFPGCRESWRHWLKPDHPIRWAWDTYEKRRLQYAVLTQEAEFSHVVFHRCRTRAEVSATLALLSAKAHQTEP